jgi:hypothetical protein
VALGTTVAPGTFLALLFAAVSARPDPPQHNPLQPNPLHPGPLHPGPVLRNVPHA